MVISLVEQIKEELKKYAEGGGKGVKAYNVHVISAAADVVYYYLDNDLTTSPIPCCMTDANGEGDGVIFGNENDSITLYSSIGKSVEDINVDYSTDVVLSGDSVINVRLMPEGAIYWYGNTLGKNWVDDANCRVNTGFTRKGALTMNTNSMSCIAPTSSSEYNRYTTYSNTEPKTLKFRVNGEIRTLSLPALSNCYIIARNYTGNAITFYAGISVASEVVNYNVAPITYSNHINAGNTNWYAMWLE